jgi:hypothetical protein
MHTRAAIERLRKENEQLKEEIAITSRGAGKSSTQSISAQVSPAHAVRGSIRGIAVICGVCGDRLRGSKIKLMCTFAKLSSRSGLWKSLTNKYIPARLAGYLASDSVAGSQRG